MNRTAFIRIKGFNVNYLKENSAYILLLVFVVASIFLGVIVCSNNSYLMNYSKELFLNYLKNRVDLSYFRIFLNSFISTIKISIIIFLCGTSVLGTVISPILLSLSAFTYGGLAAYLYNTYGLTGILYNLFVFVPPSILFIFALLLSVRECVIFSKLITGVCIRNSKPRNLFNDFRSFCLKHIIVLIILILSSLIDATLYGLFEKFFNF